MERHKRRIPSKCLDGAVKGKKEGGRLSLLIGKVLPVHACLSKTQTVM